MNRRQAIGLMMASGVTVGIAGSRGGPGRVLAHTATPFAPFDGGTCDVDLDAADLMIEMEIPDEVYPDQLDQVESLVSARLNTLGWTSCSVDRSERLIFVNLQVPRDTDGFDEEQIREFLSAAGRVDAIDVGVGTLEIGEIVTTSTTPMPRENAPEVNVVYDAILTNEDFVSVELANGVAGDPVARFMITAEAAKRLAAFSSENEGAMMPLVLDGEVILTPIIQSAIGDEFDLQPVDKWLVDRLRIFAGKPAYPAALTVNSYKDLRS